MDFMEVGGLEPRPLSPPCAGTALKRYSERNFVLQFFDFMKRGSELRSVMGVDG